jgi:hypothetical protein
VRRQSLDQECTTVDHDNQLPLINAGVNVGDVRWLPPPRLG